MPIRDRTRRRLVRLGVIRLGHKEKNKKGVEYPVQDDHFILTDAPEIAAFYAEQGIEEVRELDVLLPFPDVDRNFDANYQVWAGGVLVCQGDGEYVQYATPHRAEVKEVKRNGNVIGHRTSVYNAPGDTLVSNGVAQDDFTWNGTQFAAGEYVPCPGQRADLYPHCAACKLNGLLKIMMADPELFRMGYYQISTGSKRNYDTIMGTLEMVPAERLNGIPFKLRMVSGQTTYQDQDGKRKKGRKWFLQLEPDPEFTRQLYARQASRMVESPQPVAAIPASTGSDWDSIIADPVAPPPYAADQTPDEAMTTETATPEVMPDDDFDPTTIQSKYDLQQACIEHLGYENDTAVWSAYKRIFPHGDPALSEAYYMLRDDRQAITA